MGRKGASDDVEAAVLRALAARAEEGLTVFELRHRVAADIDELERTLEGCKRRGLIRTDRSDDRLVIRPTDAGLAAAEAAEAPSVFDRIRERLPL